MQMAKLNIFSRGQYVVLAGTVVKVIEGTGSAAGQVVTLTLEGEKWDKNQKKNVRARSMVSFWNSKDEKKVSEGKGQLADRIRKAKVHVGSFLTVLAVRRDDGKLNGLNFQYSGVLKIQGGDKYTNEDGTEGVTKDVNIIIGTITKVVLDDERGMARVTIPTTGRDNETIFHSISVWNTENSPSQATACLDYLAPYTKDDKKVYRQAIFVCGENTHFGKTADDPTAGNSYNCYRFEKIVKTKADNNEKDDCDNDSVVNPGNAGEDEFLNIPDSLSDEDGFVDISDDADLPWMS